MRPANLRACVATVSVTALLAGCGAERREAKAPEGTFVVSVERASFPQEQRLAQHARLVLTVRNAGARAIADLVVTVRGFADRSGATQDADRGHDLWIVDRGPAGAATAVDDTWSAGRLAPGRSATLRWDVVAAVPGRHELRYEIAAATAGPARAELATGGSARGTFTVRVTDAPPKVTVDPRTGGVVRGD